ncbi:hypothetical protein P4U03_30560 [Bacillus mycoides]|uniref:Uncharacterized protein n=1 Tax=Bacillus thuringiensis serovar navarrensis TaxID=339658 RepID=A0A243ALF7_BACTU|nr:MULTISPECIES: hypothetical protein [Bacillus cereus group]MED1270806.1 hypothetical protein [Bacillus mycoides]OFD35971.1 hypothetical protein BWGOE3_57400 [Bacillus mycoides]OFD36194.1 hypothetical protein BWGOE2_55320 [Bacillus mycoides]OFD52981.1 hypothetical protein BWGOE4_55380 [Bacillus mycoides]OFD53181.1 hypothetical protein BWGOE6_56370 [Bacillus mycoides]
MKKLPIIVCTLGVSIGLLGTSVVGATSDSSKSFTKAEISNAVQDTSEGVQPRWWANQVGKAVGSALVCSGAVGNKAWSTNGSAGTNYASAGGMVGGHAPEMEIEEFGR